MAGREGVAMTGYGIVSRVTPVHTAVRNCTRDEGRPFEFGNQVLISSHRKLLLSKAMVVNGEFRAAGNHFFSGRRRDEFIDKRCNNHRRIVAYGVLNCATSPTDRAVVDPVSCRLGA
jgi:hypothetical protein